MNIDDEHLKTLTLLVTSSILISMYAFQNRNKVKRRRYRRMWVKEIYLKRKEQGFQENLIKEMRLSDPSMFFNFTRMTVQAFDTLLSLVGEHLIKHSPREPISATQRLILTLRHLATGDSYPNLAYSFRISPSTICNIVREVCNVLWEVLSPIYLQPLTEQQWLKIAEDYYNIWQLPNCLGAIDGKHVQFQAPAHSGSQFFHYKKHFSTILLAVCDARYFFIYVDIGSYGAQSDGGVLRNSNFGKYLKNGTLNIPSGLCLPNTQQAVPMYFVGDEAFPLQINLLRPYSKRRLGGMPEDEIIFNYRLSRARRTIENTFGVMVARFRIFHRVINAAPETVDGIVKATTCLHNYIKSQKSTGNLYCADNYVDKELGGVIIPGEWRREVPSEGALHRVQNIRFGNRNAPREAWDFRDYMKDYLNGIGSAIAPWQFDHITRSN